MSRKGRMQDKNDIRWISESTARLTHHVTTCQTRNGQFSFALDISQLSHLQSSRIEILNAGGYRSDGRRQYELRTINIDLSPQGSGADGSATLTHGLTQVSVCVFGPREAKMRSQTFHDRANVNIEVGIASFSSSERRRRGRGDKYVLFLNQSVFSTSTGEFLSYLRL